MSTEKPWVVSVYRPASDESGEVAAFASEALATAWLEAGGLVCDDSIGPDTTTWAPCFGRSLPVLLLTRKP